MTTWGSGAAAAWDAAIAGRAAGSEFDPGDGSTHFAAAVPESYRPHAQIPRNLVHFMDRGTLIALDAALQALEMAGLGPGAGDARRFAVADGLAYRAPGQGTLFAPYGQAIARVLGVRGPVLELGGAEASGMAAIVAGARLIATGAADVVVAGAAQALQQPLLEHLAGQGFAAASFARPFDAVHAGFVPAEGAACVVLEAEEHARARGAETLARIAGAGEIFDSTCEPLAVSGATEAGRAVQAALGEAGYLQNQVDLAVSCADGRPAMDLAEGFGLLRTFGRHAHYAPVTAPAGALGSALAASGPLAVVMALEAMGHQQTFPIAGFETAEEGIALTYARAAQRERISCVLVTSLGLGGTNVSLLLER